MARTSSYPQYSFTPKGFHKWSCASKYPIKDIGEHMRKLLIYYPKNIRALKSLTLQISSQVPTLHFIIKTDSVKLYFRVMRRYKKEFFRHFSIESSRRNIDLWQKTGGLESLKVSKSSRSLFLGSVDKVPAVGLDHDVKRNKFLKVVEIDGFSRFSSETLVQLEHITTLSSIHFKDIPFTYLQERKRIFDASKLSIQNISITLSQKDLRIDNSVCRNNVANQILRMTLELPFLKRIEFIVEQSSSLNFNSIPFNILKKREISYSFQIRQDQELNLLTPNEIGLANLEFLGLHFKDIWLFFGQNWDVFQEEYLKVQKACKRSLILSLFYMKEVDLSHLFHVCKNINTLEIVLSYRNFTSGISFASLKHLPNLKTVFIELSSINKRVYMGHKQGKSIYREEKARCSEDLFISLAQCARTLKSVSLHLYGESLNENNAEILHFFNAVADTLTYFTLKFTFEPGVKARKIGVFYKGISLLKRVESLNISYGKFNWRNKFDTHSGLLKKILLNKSSLREFSLLCPSVASKQVSVDYQLLQGVEKLSLDFFSLDPKSQLFDRSMKFKELKYLDITVRMGDTEGWGKLLKLVKKLPKIQVLFLSWEESIIRDRKDEEEHSKFLILNLEVVFKSHSNLKFLAFGISRDPEIVNLFVRGSSKNLPSQTEVDSFFGRSLLEIPQTRTQKIHLLLSE